MRGALAPYVDWSLTAVLRGGVAPPSTASTWSSRALRGDGLLARLWGSARVVPAASSATRRARSPPAAAVVGERLSPSRPRRRCLALPQPGIRDPARLRGAMVPPCPGPRPADAGSQAGQVSLAVINGRRRWSSPAHLTAWRATGRVGSSGGADRRIPSTTRRTRRRLSPSRRGGTSPGGHHPGRVGIPMYSTVTGCRSPARADRRVLVRRPAPAGAVHRTAETLLDDGFTVFVERARTRYSASVCRRRSRPRARRRSLSAHCGATTAAWLVPAVAGRRLHPGHPRQLVRRLRRLAPPQIALPAYPFQRRRYWLGPGRAGDVPAAGSTRPHPLLSAATAARLRRLPSPAGSRWRTSPGWPTTSSGERSCSRSGMVELAVHAAGRVGCGQWPSSRSRPR